MRLLHVRLEALTATFKIPFINSGVVIACPVPPYSALAGLISCCKGKWIDREETMIGFSYTYQGIGRDLETTKRFGLDDKGRLKRNSQDGIVTREFHVNPVLDLYLTNLELKKYFIQPVGVPVLGRSQDIAWISLVEEIEVFSAIEGRIKPTLIPFPCNSIGGRLIRLCDYFSNDSIGYLREPEKMILYQIVPYAEEGVYIKKDNLYCLKEGEVIYLHRLGEKD